MVSVVRSMFLWEQIEAGRSFRPDMGAALWRDFLWNGLSQDFRDWMNRQIREQDHHDYAIAVLYGFQTY